MEYLAGHGHGNACSRHAAAFYQDISGWSDAALTTSTDMFTDAGAWLNRLERDGTTSTDGPSNVWVHKPCLVNERVQSGWCVPCGGMFSNAAGDDPAAGVDTACDGDSQGLKDAVNACLSAVPSGEACCSTDTNCADPSSARCGSAGCVDMPEWDVSLVTDMSELFKGKAQFNADISAWDTSQVTDMGYMFYNAESFNQDIGSWNTSQVTDMMACSWRRSVQPRHRSWIPRRSGHEGHVRSRSAFNQASVDGIRAGRTGKCSWPNVHASDRFTASQHVSATARQSTWTAWYRT